MVHYRCIDVFRVNRRARLCIVVGIDPHARVRAEIYVGAAWRPDHGFRHKLIVDRVVGIDRPVERAPPGPNPKARARSPAAGVIEPAIENGRSS